jgi:adenylosuccinate synthase
MPLSGSLKFTENTSLKRPGEGFWQTASKRREARPGAVPYRLDVLDGFEEIPVCTGYRLDGDACEEMPAEVEALGRVEPTYEALRGWNRPTGVARALRDLPSEARAYLDRLEELSGVPVRYVSVGTRRDQIIET